LVCDLIPAGDAPSEVMSSSTISRAEENARLKDLEESFEERYTKVKYHIILLTKKKKKTLWPQSASELYRPNDRRLSAKLVPTFCI
jgi:hypothetical protein